MKKLNALRMMVERKNVEGEPVTREDGEKIYDQEEVKLDINSTTHGVLSANRISNLNSGKITSGVLDIARIPQVPWTQVSGKPSTFSPSTHTHSWSQVTSRPPLFDNATHLGTSNLNNITTRGVYYQSANANATTARNYPVSYAGTLVVTSAAGIVQEYTCYGTYSHLKYTRGFYNSSWSSWSRVSFEGHTHSASQISSGTLAEARIPNLPASKITSGTIADARLPAKATPADFVVEQGSNYTKWNSGRLEKWSTANVNLNSDGATTVSYPSGGGAFVGDVWGSHSWSTDGASGSNWQDRVRAKKDVIVAAESTRWVIRKDSTSFNTNHTDKIMLRAAGRWK